jgi:predicted ester cyclase
MKAKHIMIATIMLLLITKDSWSQNSKTNNKMETSIEKNKAVVRTLFEDILNKKRTARLKEVIADEYQGPRGAKGYEGFLEPVKPLLAAFPDIEWKILDIVGEGDKVMLRWHWTGTHKAAFNEHAPTGKIVSSDGMAVFLVKNGKVTGSNILTDRLGFLQQIGAVPVN